MFTQAVGYKILPILPGPRPLKVFLRVAMEKVLKTIIFVYDITSALVFPLLNIVLSEISQCKSQKLI